MERFKSTFAATAAIALGLAAAAHLRHPGDLAPVARAEAAVAAPVSGAPTPRAPAAAAWTPAQRELLATLADRATDGVRPRS